MIVYKLSTNVKNLSSDPPIAITIGYRPILKMKQSFPLLAIVESREDIQVPGI
jgi:hypothetical protein